MFRTPGTPAKASEESNTVAPSTYHPPYNQNVSIEPGIPSDLEIQLSAACSEVDEDLTVAPDATDINAGANWRRVTRIDDSAIPKGGSFEPRSATLWEEFQKLESDFEQLSATIQTLRTHQTSSLSAYAVQNQTAFDVLAECSTQQDSRILSSFEQCGVLQIRLAAVEERLRYCLSHPEFQLFRQYVEVNVNHLHHRVAAIEHRMNLAVSDYRAPNDWEYRRVDQETESEGNVETEQNLNEGLSEESVRNMIGVLRKEMDILQQHAEKRHEQGQWAFLRSSSVESEVERLSGVLSQLATRMEDLTNRFQSLEDELPVLKQDPNDKAATELPDKCYEELNDTKKPLASFTVEVESRLAQVDQNLCSQEESNKKLAAFTEEIQGGLEVIDYVNEVRDKNIQHLQSSSAELHSAWESIEGLTEQKWKQVFGSYRKVILNCEQEIKQSRNYRKQVEELLEWKKETERSRDTELVILKQQVKALREDSQKKDVFIGELRPLVARHESLLEKGHTVVRRKLKHQ